jgi:hypothetical protein
MLEYMRKDRGRDRPFSSPLTLRFVLQLQFLHQKFTNFTRIISISACHLPAVILPTFEVANSEKKCIRRYPQ